MAFFTKIDENNIVKQIEVVENSIATTEQAGIEFLEQLHGSKFNWKQMGTAPFMSNGVETTRNYAGINFVYDEANDIFIAPQPYPSWTLDEATCTWEAPTPKPDGNYTWNEETQAWDQIDD